MFTLRHQVRVQKRRVADLVVRVIRYILRHVAVEILKCGKVCWIPRIWFVVVVYRAAEFVILLPQISLDQFNCGCEPQECGVATGKPVVVCGKRLTGYPAASPPPRWPVEKNAVLRHHASEMRGFDSPIRWSSSLTTQRQIYVR